MLEIKKVLETIDALPLSELEHLQQRIEQRKRDLLTLNADEIEAKIAAFDAATAHFWDGFTDAEVEQIVADMNEEYIEDEDKA